MQALRLGGLFLRATDNHRLAMLLRMSKPHCRVDYFFYIHWADTKQVTDKLCLLSGWD